MTTLRTAGLSLAESDPSDRLSSLLLRIAAAILVAAVVSIVAMRLSRQSRARRGRLAIEQMRAMVLEQAVNASALSMNPDEPGSRVVDSPRDAARVLRRALRARGGIAATEDALAAAMTTFRFVDHPLLNAPILHELIDGRARSRRLEYRLGALRAAGRLRLPGYTELARQSLARSDADSILTAWNYLVSVKAVSAAEVLDFWREMTPSPVQDRVGAFFTSMGPAATAALCRLLDAEATAAAAALLRWCEPAPSLGSTIARLATDDLQESVRIAAAAAWAVHVPVEHPRAVTQAMNDPHEQVRRAAYAAAGPCGIDPSTCARGLTDPDLRVRYAAASSLAMTAQGVDILQVAAQDPDLAIRAAARSGLSLHFTRSPSRPGDRERLLEVLRAAANDSSDGIQPSVAFPSGRDSGSNSIDTVPGLDLLSKVPAANTQRLAALWPPEPWVPANPADGGG